MEMAKAHMASTIWQVTSGNGWPTGILIPIMANHQRRIHPGRPRERYAYCEAAPGVWWASVSALLIVMQETRLRAAWTLASVAQRMRIHRNPSARPRTCGFALM